MDQLPELVKEIIDKGKLEEMAVNFVYRNWRGVLDIRRVLPVEIKFESNEYHPEKQWLLHGYDLDKKAMRTYAIKEISDWGMPRD